MSGIVNQPALVDLPRPAKKAGAVSAASESSSGTAEIATQAETNTGTDDVRFITPLKFATRGLLQGVHTVFVPATYMRPTVSNGCAALVAVETTSGRPDMLVLDFDTAADEHAQFKIAFPDSWNEGTITYRIYWTTAATDTDGVAWALQGVAVANDNTIDVVYGTAVVVIDDNISAAEDMLITAESGDVTIAGSPAAGEMCFFRVLRDVGDDNDDMTEDARLIGLQLFYTLDAGNDA